MKITLRTFLLSTALLLSGCVEYKYSIWPNGKQIQMGSYIENKYLQPALFCTKTGQKITQLNKATEEYYRTNEVISPK